VNANLIKYLLIVLLFFSCSDGPTVPQDNGGTNPPPVGYSPPAMFPLAPGASWTYSFYDSYKYSKESCTRTEKFGNLVLLVTSFTEWKESIEFKLQAHLKIDSLSYLFKADCNASIIDGITDTSYKLVNVLDTTTTTHLLVYNDTIWYKDMDSTRFMMTANPQIGSQVNLKIFNLGRYDNFIPSINFSERNEDLNIITFLGYVSSSGDQRKAVFMPDSGGLYLLESTYDFSTGIASTIKVLRFRLLEYIPGSSIKTELSREELMEAPVSLGPILSRKKLDHRLTSG